MKDLQYLETILRLTQRALDGAYEGSDLWQTMLNQKNRILKDIEEVKAATPPKKVTSKKKVKRKTKKKSKKN